MKKLTAFLLALACVFLLCACDALCHSAPVVFSFSGECEQFAVYNGVVVMNDDQEVFDGGELKVTQPDLFTDITFYSGTFYTRKDGERWTILSNSVADMTGGALDLNGDLGRISGGKNKNVDTFQENLWFELTVTDGNGNTNIYPLELTLTEITGNADA